MSIVFIGLPACGKTVIGSAVAAELGVSFIDTDALIEQRTGKLIREIFAEDGEPYFREMEIQAASDALQQSSVVALGGGAVLNPEIRSMLDNHQVIWLDVSVTTLTRRAGMNRLRPLLLGDVRTKMAALAEDRLPIYQQMATWRIDAERSIHDIVREVLALVSSGIHVISVSSEHPYDVVIGPHTSLRASAMLTQASKTAIIHPPVLAEQARILSESVNNPVIIEVPAGEQAKTATELDRCWRILASSGLTRSDAVIGLGGGATTDLAGFVAATFLRGITYISIPTTVLGMADAGVGGKTGINLDEGKNLVGCFYEPSTVLCDLDLLTTLPDDEIRSGLAEIVKCGFIADTRILDSVTQNPSDALDISSDGFAQVLSQAIQVKADVVSADFRENSRAVGREALNYGHTLGHAIEKLEGFTWAHGYAISVGMVFAGEVAHRLGILSAQDLELHRTILSSLGLPTSYSGAEWAQVRATMSLDKKARGSQLRLILLEGIGQVTVVADIDESLLEDAYNAIGDHVHS